MDVPDAEAVTNVDNTFLYFFYGFLILLGICILISLGKTIYHFYKVRREQNMVSADDTIDTECHSITNGLSVSDRPSETNVQDSERLRLQLDKLRRLLNRLNAMGTFSRDTIGDLSAESAIRVNQSKAASSDMSEFWSSIDYDEFDDSTINEGKFGKTPTEKSISPSISDFSLDTSGIPFDNVHHKNFATSSRENVLNVSSAFNRRTNPSDAIIQILTILDSIMLKNRNSDRQLKNGSLNIEKTTVESLNSQAFPASVYASVSSTLAQNVRLSPSVSNNKEFYTSGSLNSDIVITMPEQQNSETLKSDTKVVGGGLSSKPILLQQSSKTIESQCNVPSTASLEAKISKVMSVVNITSSGSKNFYSTELSSKSLNSKISVSQSISLCVDPFTCLSTHAKGISKSLSAAPRDENCKNMQSETNVSKLSPCTLNIEAIHRSHSLSDLLDKTLLSIETSIEKSCSYEKEHEIPNLKTESKSKIKETLSASSAHLQNHPLKNNELLGNEETKSNSSQKTNTEISSSVSCRNLHSPLFFNSLPLKSSISEPEMKHSPLLRTFSPNVSPGSEAFLSPLVIDISPSEKIDWKSPVEINSDIVVRNLTPHNKNTMLSRKSCIWSTPPLPIPKEIVTDEIVI